LNGGTCGGSLHYLKICGLSPKFLEKCDCSNLAQPKTLHAPLDGFNVNSGGHDDGGGNSGKGLKYLKIEKV
jgi:hypothetical protein